MSSSYHRQRKVKLHKINPACHWCGVVTILPNRNNHEEVQKLDTCATLDHLHDRYNMWDRMYGWRIPGTKYRNTLVLACRKCNERRASEATKNLSKWELWSRSGAFPWYVRLLARLLGLQRYEKYKKYE